MHMKNGRLNVNGQQHDIARMAVNKPSMQEQNLQSALLFMQQDHAKTLKGLHEEINKLQSKCKDLTFQLAMETTSTSQEDYYRTKCDEKDEEIVQWRTKAKQLEEQLAEKDSRVSQIQKRLKRQEYKHMEELKTKTDALHKLQAELLSKSEEVTMMQLTSRSTKTSTDSSADFSERRRKSATVPSVSGSSPRSSQDSPRTHHLHHHRGRRLSTDSAASLSSISSSEAGSSTSITKLEPHPPPPPSTSTYNSSNKPTRRSLNTVINRPASGRKLSSDEMAMSAESRAEILEITKSQKERLQMSGGSASGVSKLPPIPPKGPPPPPRLHKANSAAFARRKPPSADSTGSNSGSPKDQVEVETLAVDQVNGTASKINLRHAQEFNSQDM